MSEHHLPGLVAVVVIGSVPRWIMCRLDPPSICRLPICGIAAAVPSISGARLIKIGYGEEEQSVPLILFAVIDTVAVHVFDLTEIERENLVAFPSISPKVG